MADQHTQIEQSVQISKHHNPSEPAPLCQADLRLSPPSSPLGLGAGVPVVQSDSQAERSRRFSLEDKDTASLAGRPCPVGRIAAGSCVARAWEISYTTPGVLRPASGAAGVGNRLAWKAERQSNAETSNELRRNGLILPVLRKPHKRPI